MTEQSNTQKNKIALITGITGQDGSYLTELLLKKGYEVHGLVRRVAHENENQHFSRIAHVIDKVSIHYGDVTDYATLFRLIATLRPDEVYHLAAQSQVGISFKDDFGTFRANTDGTHYLLSAIKETKPDCRFYFAGTSELFGCEKPPQNEHTPFEPVSPYAVSKLAAFHLVKIYRKAYGIFACSGILFNHESPRRGFEFVTRKITSTAAKIKLGLATQLSLGNIDVKRDWGFAGDYVEAMWLMLQRSEPDDYVVGTGETHSIRDFLEASFGFLNLDWKKYVVVDQKLLRPLDVNELKADSQKARAILGWSPKVGFKELVEMMVKADLDTLRRNRVA